ncbi:hypothetical protein CLOP_g11961 [Closterium sp. NIES-67]|nr:hypothetical protein CLOP_g11961 [Closterium sp. NIES-67]
MASRAVSFCCPSVHAASRVSTNEHAYGHAYGSTYRTRFCSLRPNQKRLQARPPAGLVPPEPVRRGSLLARQPGAVDDVAATETELSLPLAREVLDKAGGKAVEEDGQEVMAGAKERESTAATGSGVQPEELVKGTSGGAQAIEGTLESGKEDRGGGRAEEGEEEGEETEVRVEGAEAGRKGKDAQERGKAGVAWGSGVEGEEEEEGGGEDEAGEDDGDAAAVWQKGVTESLGLGGAPSNEADFKTYVRKWGYDAVVLLQTDGEPSALDWPSVVEAAAKEGGVALQISLPALEDTQQVGWRVFEAVRAVGTLSAMGLRAVLCSSSTDLSAFIALSFLTFAGRHTLAEACAAMAAAAPDVRLSLQPWQQCVDLLSSLDTPRVSAMAQAVYERRRDSGGPGGPADDWAQAQLQYVQQLVGASVEASADIPLAASEVVFHKAAAAARVQIDHHKSLAEAAMDAAAAARRAATVTEERSDALEAQITELEFLVSELSREKEAGHGEKQAAVARVQELEDTIRQAREREARAAEAAQAAKERLAFVTRQGEILKSKVDAEKEAVAAVRERVALLTSQLKDAEQREEAARKAASEMAENMTRLVSTLRNEVAELKAEVAAAEGRERELEAALEDGARQLRAALDAEAAVGALRVDAERAEQELEAMAGRAGDLLSQVEQGRQVAAQLEAQVAEGQQLAARLADEVDRAKKAVGEGEQKHAVLARDVDTLRATLTRIQGDDQLLSQEAQRLAQESSLLKRILVGVSGLAVLLLLLLLQPGGGSSGDGNGGGSGEVRGGLEEGWEQEEAFVGRSGGGGGGDGEQGSNGRLGSRRAGAVEAVDVGGAGDQGSSGVLLEVSV